MAIARAAVANTYSTFMALVRIALNATEGRFRWLWRSAKLWVVIVHTLRALLKKAQAVGRLLCRPVEGTVTDTGRTASAEGKRSVGQLGCGTRDNQTFFVTNGLFRRHDRVIALVTARGPAVRVVWKDFPVKR